MNYITPIQLREILESEAPITIINVLSEKDFLSHHIPNSMNIDVSESGFAHKIEEIILDKEDPIILYGVDNTLMRPKIAFDRLSKIGYKNCLVLKGGIKEWEKDGFETIRN
ncbi:rhodanese-like domain-containing protein [Halosquirtibacter laminarini]|uniref:Rhodanese-like domain-containing protein n=1 Tax=Halosquirtibacter laminarini TaxID=3374600 RepID=A0AC61NNU9_9BACT|nr:rhodanese-like domain-containing protein [Prolixibacteraceae bacterium]